MSQFGIFHVSSSSHLPLPGCGGGGRERSWFYHTPINHKTFHPTNALNKDWIESQVELLRNAKVLCMYLLNIVTPHKLCGPLSTEAGGGVVLRRVIVSILKSALILILKLNRSENIKEQRDYTVLCIYSRLVLCWYCIHDEGSPLHSSWKCWQIWGYCGHIPALWPTMEICHRDKLHVTPAPTHWWQGSSGPILELFLTTHN